MPSPTKPLPRQGLPPAGPLWYLGQPYSNNPEYAYAAANAALVELTTQGLSVLSPIAMFHMAAKQGRLPIHWEFWEEHNYAMLTRCQGLIIFKLTGWEMSQGLKAEIAVAETLGLPLMQLSSTLVLA